MADSLFGMTRRLHEYIENGFDSETGVIPEPEEIDKLFEDVAQKKENVALAYKEYTAMAKAIKEERDELYKRQKACENKAEWLKEYLAKCMPEGEKFSTPKVSISWRKSESVEVSDLELIPDEFIKVKYEADKTAIKAAYKNGQYFSGAKLITSQNIQIK